MPNPAAIPCASVVFPAPIGPRRQTTSPASSRLPIACPIRRVSSALRLIVLHSTLPLYHSLLMEGYGILELEMNDTSDAAPHEILRAVGWPPGPQYWGPGGGRSGQQHHERVRARAVP